MAAYVVDFQAFKTMNAVHYFMIKSPTSFYILGPELKKRVNYSTEYIHGIKWDTEYIEKNNGKCFFYLYKRF